MIDLWLQQTMVWKVCIVLAVIVCASVGGAFVISLLFPLSTDDEEALDAKEAREYQAFRTRQQQREIARFCVKPELDSRVLRRVAEPTTPAVSVFPEPRNSKVGHA